MRKTGVLVTLALLFALVAPFLSASQAHAAGKGGAFCAANAKQLRDLGTGQGSAGELYQALISGDKVKAKALLAKARNEGNKILAQAPAELKAPLKVSQKASEKILGAFEKANFDFAKLDPNALSSVSTPEFTKAANQISAYLKNVCGIDVTAAAAAAAGAAPKRK